MADPLAETWAIHNRVNVYLLDAIEDDAIGAALPKSRNVHDLFATCTTCGSCGSSPQRRRSCSMGWRNSKPKLCGSKKKLREALVASGKAIETVLREASERGGKVKGFKPHAAAFLGYLISHESHHRGQIGWTLKQTGHPLDQKIAYGMWEWGTR